MADVISVAQGSVAGFRADFSCFFCRYGMVVCEMSIFIAFLAC